MKKFFIIALSVVFLSLCAYSQESLPNGYREIRLGMNIEDVKDALQADYIFNYRGERDVSFLPAENQTLIETSSDTWLERCWFQFHNDTLYTIIINFNSERIDYFSVYNELLEKYGEHVSLSPERVVWESNSITMSLERPVSVKYVDKAVFESIRDKAIIDQTIMEDLRENILGDL